MQTIPKRFTFKTDCNSPLYTARDEGETFRITWGNKGETVQYSRADVSGNLDRGVWKIREVKPGTDHGTRTVDSLKEAEGYKLGDKVKMVLRGRTYDFYETWAKAHNLKNWKSGAFPKMGDVFTVVEIGPHSDGSEKHIFGLQADDGATFIVDVEGFEKVASVKQPRPALKPFQRVRCANGKFYVVAESARLGGQFLVRQTPSVAAWVSQVNLEAPDSFAIEAIYEAPHERYYLDVNEKGNLIWEDTREAERAKLDAEIKELETKAAELRKQREAV